MPESRDRVAAHRARLRAQGLRPLEIWVPDPGSPHFIDQAARQAAAVATSDTESVDQAWVDAVSDRDGS
jgi:hypothetical protein